MSVVCQKCGGRLHADLKYLTYEQALVGEDGTPITISTGQERWWDSIVAVYCTGCDAQEEETGCEPGRLPDGEDGVVLISPKPE